MFLMSNKVMVRRHFLGLTIETNNFAFEVKVILGLESTVNYFTGLMGGWLGNVKL